MPYNDDVPKAKNNKGEDLISMRNNFKYIKDAFNFLFSNWSDNTTDGFRGNTNTGFTHHITGATIDFPVNNMQNKIAFMCGNKDTLVWFYTNTAPPGWKIETGGGDKVLAIRKDAPDDKEGYPAETTFDGNWIPHPHVHRWTNDVSTTFDSDGKTKKMERITPDWYHNPDGSNKVFPHEPYATLYGIGTHPLITGKYRVLLLGPNYTGVSEEKGKWRPAAAVGIVCRLDVA